MWILLHASDTVTANSEVKTVVYDEIINTYSVYGQHFSTKKLVEL